MKSRNAVTTSIAIVIMSGVLSLTWYSLRPPAMADGSSHISHFSFEHTTLSYASANGAVVRKVNRSLVHLESWISAVGAAVAINDLDGDGIPNDLCLVDSRTNTVTVAPAPGSPRRYDPFVLRALGSEDETTAPMGCLPGDFNQDGIMDILVYYWGRPPVIFESRRKSAVESLDASSFVQRELAPARERWFTNAALFVDLDGDGHPDILIANYFTDGEQILDSADDHVQRMNSSMSHAYNGGGKHFFLAKAAGDGSISFQESVPTILDDHDSPMSNSAASEILHGWTLAAGAGDLSHTLLPDLYLANDFGPDRLLENKSTPGNLRFKSIVGRRTFFTPKSKVLGRDSFKGMGVDFADLNNDGKLDILVSNITEEFGLQESNFVFINDCPTTSPVDLSSCLHERSERLGLARSGWSWDIKAADFDNSGTLQVVQATGFIRSAHTPPGTSRWPELHESAMGNDVFLRYPAAWHNYSVDDDVSGHDRNRFFVRQNDGRFYDESEPVGLRHDFAARGIAIADVDQDGKVDFAVANQWGSSDFYRNTSPVVGSYLTIRLLLPLSSQEPFAVGPIRRVENATYAMTAEATVVLPDGRRQLQQVNGGNGHSGKSSFDLHFGLGSSSQRDLVAILLRWRDLRGDVASRTLQLRPGQYAIILGE
jgi:hypothetical protein